MKISLTLFALLLTPLPSFGATVKISGLPLATSPSTNTFIEIADMNAVTKSSKYLLTNMATVSYVNARPTGIVGTVSNAVASAGLLSVDSSKTNGIAATFAHVTNAMGVAVSQAQFGYLSDVPGPIGAALDAKATATLQSTLAHAGTLVADFAATNVFSCALTGSVTIASTSLNTNRSWRALLTAPATNISATLPAGWKPLGTALTNILAAKSVMLSCESWGTADTNVFYAAAAQP